VTGAAGFIGSNLVEALLQTGQHVVGLDNFATGYAHNLSDVRTQVGEEAAARFRFIEGDIQDMSDCQAACEGVDHVLHQAAIGSVPRSIKEPLVSHEANVNGFVNMLIAARDAGVRRFVYASSSAVYGDHPKLPKVEAEIGTPLSPYAVTKRANELYAKTFQDCYGLEVIGLRYFNVFGRRQDPEGAYAAVIPKWIGQLLSGRTPVINGDGETSRDFCYIANTVQANLRAAVAPASATNAVYNVANGDRTTLNELYTAITTAIERESGTTLPEPVYGPFRDGDIRHSLADITAAQENLAYAPTHDVSAGLNEAIAWYLADHAAKASA
jgi:UDP-N-acetylglucosamine 4-epimerase